MSSYLAAFKLAEFIFQLKMEKKLGRGMNYEKYFPFVSGACPYDPTFVERQT